MAEIDINNLENGYYWIKHSIEGLTIAEYEHDHWWIIGATCRCLNLEIEKVYEKIKPYGDK